MANIKSAQKRVLVNAKKKDENRSILSEVKTIVKKFNTAIETNNIEVAEKMLPEVFSTIDSACAKGIIHKNNAANKKSRLSTRLSAVKSGKVTITIKKDNKTIAAEKAKAAQEARAIAKAEFEKASAEKKAAKIEAEKAKILAAEAEAKAKKPAKKEAKKTEEPKEAKAEKKPAAKKPAKKEEKAE